MTGPTALLLSPEVGESHGTRQNLVGLRDPSTIWPSRSLERRRAFQSLLSRYTRQILYGCNNPRCETPTCLSHQKRVAKGPFRPYTVLSARTLATFLASQDHPEKGLCPHEPVDIHPGPSEVKRAGKKAEIRENSFAGPESSHTISPYQSASSVRSSPIQGRKIKVHIENGHTKSLGLESETPRDRSYEGLRPHNYGRKDEDPKSFTQNLFDTVAMKLLHQPNVSDSRPPWAPWNERAQLLGSSNPDSCSLDSEAKKWTLEKTRKGAEMSLGPDTEPATAAHDHHLPPIESFPNVESNVSDTKSLEDHSDRDIVKESKGPRKHLGSLETLVDEENVRVEANVEAEESTMGKGVPALLPQPDLRPEGLVKAKPTPLRKTPVSLGRPFELTPDLSAQSLSHFSSANILALAAAARTVCRNDLFEQHCFLRFLGRTHLPKHSSRCGSYGDLLAYSGQSMTYILSHVEPILQSFVHVDESYATSKLVWSYDFASIVDLIRKLRHIDPHPHKIYSSLWIIAGKLYPFSAFVNKRRSMTASDLASFSLEPQYTSPTCSLNDVEACHIIKIIFAALVGSVPKCTKIGWLAVRKLHASGQVAPFVDPENSPAEQRMVVMLVRTLQIFENEMCLSLMRRLARSIDTRYHLTRAKELTEDSSGSRGRFPDIFSRVIDYVNADHLKIRVADDKHPPSVRYGEWVDPEIEPITGHPPKWPIIIEWLRAVILKEWDGKPRVAKCSAVGGALGLMLYIHEHADALRFDWDLFHTPFLSERLDLMDEPAAWANSRSNSGSTDGNSEIHLLDFPFLFPPSALVAYFRSINYASMYAAYRDSVAASRLCDSVSWPDRSSGRGLIRLLDRLHYATTEYLVLEARRDHILVDAMNEIYRRQKRELMRPLKVRMVGEEGIDHGGVQQEFFRLAIAEALNPDYGVFTTDPRTQMSWFHPSSPEPAYKFELLGILVSLAVYNGLTLPFTFPLVMYRKLAGLHNHRLEDLEDGWPELVKGLRALRDWKDGDVEDVFMRSYVFSVDKFGATEDRLIGQYEKAKKANEEDSEVAVSEKPKKVAKVVRIKKKPNARKSAVEEGNEDALRFLRGSPLHQATTQSGDEVLMSGSQSRGPSQTGSRNDALPTISGEEEASEHLKSRELKEGQVRVDDELCMSDSSSPSPFRTEPGEQNTPMVTNENRDQYIHDYIHQLTFETVCKQFYAFRYGFFTCFHPKAISLFSPSALKALVEGLPDISVTGLERAARYDGGYTFWHPTIRQFWTVVRSWPQEKIRKLLEFVTASDRLPVGGVGKLVFTVQKNGVGDERLPTSLTCFGRLLLPEYTKAERLREALEKAVENSKGFGQP